MLPARRPRVVAFWIVLLLTLAPSFARAQTVTASITGLVSDQTGAALPGVTITAKNQATDVPYVTTSNEAGNYTITSLPVGTYLVTAELTGFRTVTTNPVTLEPKQVAHLDVKMLVGAVQEHVLVAGVLPVLQTQTSTADRVVAG